MFFSVITKKRGGGDTPMHTMDSQSIYIHGTKKPSKYSTFRTEFGLTSGPP